MKNLLIVALFLFLIPCVFADEIYVKRGDNRDAGFSVVGDEIFNRAAPRLLLECQFPKLETNVVSTQRGDFAALSIPRFQHSNVVGNPGLPMMTRLIEVPFGANPVVRAVAMSEQEFSLKDLGITAPLMPAQPSQRKDFTQMPLSYNEAAYQQNSYQQPELVTVREVGIMRNMRLVSLEVAPIAYNPVQGKIKVYNDLRLEISLEGSDLAQTASMQQKYYSPYFSWASSKILTPASLATSREETATPPVVYAIVADRMFANDLRPFIDWKTSKGFIVDVAYTDTIGKTKEEIQKYLHGLYNNGNAEKPAPSFVLLVGDNEQIPAFAGTAGSYVTDLNYVAVTADKIPDMLCGRFSAKTSAQLVPQIEKTMEYEQYLFKDNSFLKNAVMVAGWDSSHAKEWGWPQINYGNKYYFNKEHGYDNVFTVLTSGSQQQAANIVNAVSAGAAYVNYTAHGSQTDWSDPNFTKTNIDSLQNKSRYPLVVGNCCLTNSFQVDVCFGEAWLRAKDKGAIGYIGGSSYTYWDEDLWWGNGYYPIAHPNSTGAAPDKAQTGIGAYDAGFEKEAFSNAAFMVAGNLAVEESTSPRKVYYWEVYHLMGDPSLMVYWGVPTALQVNHPAEITAGTNSVTVKSEAGAYIGISNNGEWLGAAVVKGNGEAVVNLKAADAGSLTIVVTKKNRQPYSGTIKVK